MTGEVASGNPLELGTILKRSRATFEVYAEPEVAQGQQSSNEKEQVSLEPPKKKRAGKPKYADTPYASSLITLSKTTGREIERMPMLTVALKKFELFAELPAEVRAAIWKILSDRSQQIRRVDTIVHRGPSGEKHAGYRMSGNLPPAVLRATKESRNEALRRFSLVHSFLPSDSTTFPDPKMIYVNFYVDSIYVAGMLSYPTLLSYFSKLGSDAMTQNPTINHPSELIRDLAFSSVQSSELTGSAVYFHHPVYRSGNPTSPLYAILQNQKKIKYIYITIYNDNRLPFIGGSEVCFYSYKDLTSRQTKSAYHSSVLPRLVQDFWTAPFRGPAVEEKVWNQFKKANPKFVGPEIRIVRVTKGRARGQA